MKNIIVSEIKEIKDELIEINDFMYNYPELGNEEFKSSKLLKDILIKYGFTVESNLANQKTSFKAVYDSKKDGPTIGFLCEYDALPDIGHGCGHNMIGTMGVGAGIALSKVIDEIGGKIVVLGTPAEETDGGKVHMVNAGVFEDIDVAMIVHPAEKSFNSGTSLAMDAIEFEFIGKPSHAAAEPEAGINALDGVIMTFNGINALREHLKSDVRIHGIIKEGGVAANIVPERAVAQFYVRSKKRNYLNEVVDKVNDIAKGASLMTGATLNIRNYEISYDDMRTNEVLSKVFKDNMKYMDVDDLEENRSGLGSIDMGNVSYVVPSIHPYIGIKEGVVAHTKEFADNTITPKAHERIIQGACAMALSGYDVIMDKELLKAIKDAFENK
ncbi:M20 family metallopeptidase [Anaeromicrobium sediminis]|uniref:M20 family metallopeptidase n=1 Tax=Anaeromicrobium sediminis TaxID=1478221 RepID=UPI001A9A3732|nr:M20 family metallopeptidase [Anaeromicrobium sediminis]